MEQEKKKDFCCPGVATPPPPLPPASPYGQSNYLPHRDKKDYEKGNGGSHERCFRVFFTILLP